MRRLTNLNYLAALAMAFAAITFVSCFSDEVVRVPDVGVDSNTICFGANVGWADEDEITRGAEARRTLNEGTISSEEGSVSLPLIVTQEDGIRTATPVAETRGSKVTLGTQVERMRVWATWAKNGNESNYFTSANADDGTVADPEQGVDFVRNSSGIYYSTPTFMWPGDGSFTFTAVANLPENIGDSFTASLNANGTAPEKFTYRVPEVAENQHDIMIAKATGVSGSQGASVPLNFQHIMAAVNFKVGSVVAGTIKSISLTGVYNKGEYLIAKNEWVNLTIEDGGVFAANIGGDRVVGTDNALNGTQLNSDTATFMMIPQSPFTGAELVVEFEHVATETRPAKSYTLRASIQGNNWAMNTTTNYLINIDHNFELQIVPLDNVLDSHYIITKVEISSESPSGWTLIGRVNDGADVSIQLEQDVNSLAKQGFWTDKKASKDSNGNIYVPTNAASARGEHISNGGSLSGSGAISNQIVYVFVPENITDEIRTITLMLTGGGKSKTLTLTQKPVQWYNPNGTADTSSMGLEVLIENGQIDWGFCWEGMNATFVLTQGNGAGKYDPETDSYGNAQIPPGQDKKIRPAMELAGIDMTAITEDPNYYIQLVPPGGGKYNYYIKIDLSKVANVGVGEWPDDGWQNTYDIYHFEGISSLRQLIDFCNSWGDIVNPDGRTTSIHNSLDYAAFYAMKRNRFHYYEELVPDVGKYMIVPHIEEKDIVWYLPAKEQFKDIIDLNADWGQQYTFNDYYWTSTAYLEDDGDTSKSYSYINGVETLSHRTEKYFTMAVRQWFETEEVEMGGNVVTPGTGGENGPGSGTGGNGGGNTGENPGTGVTPAQ